MNLRNLALLAMALGALTTALAEPVTPPGPSEAVYSLYAKGIEVARVTRRLSQPDDNSYEYQSETKTVGITALFRRVRIVETSRFSMQGDELRPEQYRYMRSGDKKKRDVSVLFDWNNNRIKHTINGDSWHMPTQPGIMDKLLYELAVMDDLGNGQDPAAYRIADGGGVRVYDFERLGEENISTPLGEYHTVKILRRKEGSDRLSIFWAADELDYLPVQVDHMEKDGSKTRAVLISLEG